jgi:hypothetical protein
MRSIKCISGSLVFVLIVLCGQGVAFAQNISPDPTWSVGLAKRTLTAYDRSSGFKDSVSKDGYVLSLGFTNVPKKEERPEIFKSLESMGLSLRLGVDTTYFKFTDPDHTRTHYAMVGNPFMGLNVLVSFLLLNDLSFDVSGVMDFGLLGQPKTLYKAPGYVYPRKAQGAWDSVEADMKLTRRFGGISCFLGLNSYQFNYSFTVSDYPSYPSDYEKKGHGGVEQSGIYAGAEYQVNEKSTLGFWGDFASAQTLFEGYQIYAKYIL